LRESAGDFVVLMFAADVVGRVWRRPRFRAYEYSG